jgi:UDP-N-acetylglucosamine 2-epimerase (non-hydrolysing)
MPEEVNRVLTDSISDLLFVTEQSGIDNLKSEGINGDKVHFVGNVMIDTLHANKIKAGKSSVLKRLKLEQKKYGVITLHRPGNVDNKIKFAEIITAFEKIQKDVKLIFPIHPRTMGNLKGTELEKRLTSMNNLFLIDPVGYLDFLWLMTNAAFVMTDSGGIQEETTILGVPCITLRENTERPVTCTEGTNRLVHIKTEDIFKYYNELKKNDFSVKYGIPKFWDGKACQRIVQVIRENSTAKYKVKSFS